MTRFYEKRLNGRGYIASEKVWALPNLFTRVYTRLEVVWSPSTKYCGAKPLRCRYNLD